MSVRVTLNCPLKPAQIETLLPFLEENLPGVRGFNGCMRVNVLLDTANEEMLLDEEWRTTENHQAYMNHIRQSGVLERLRQFLKAPPTIKYFETVEI